MRPDVASKLHACMVKAQAPVMAAAQRNRTPHCARDDESFRDPKPYPFGIANGKMQHHQ